MKRHKVILVSVLMIGPLLIVGCAKQEAGNKASQNETSNAEHKKRVAPLVVINGRVELSEDEWRNRLTPEQFRVLRGKGTEQPFTGAYWDHKGKGIYTCAACDLALFNSDTKFKSGTGWPSFWSPANEKCVQTEFDISLGRSRTEVLCKRCGSHLGHVFTDGPVPTGLRYCINSASLQFESGSGS